MEKKLEVTDTSYLSKDERSSAEEEKNRFLGIRFILSIALAALWVVISIWISIEWLREVKEVTSYFFMLFALTGIAFLPGFVIFFMYSSMMFDKRAKVDLTKIVDTTVLIAAFNEESNILKPLLAIEEQKFNGMLEVIVIDDGSRDNTSEIVRNFISSPRKHSYHLITLEKNSGKSAALNEGLKASSYNAIVSMDADTTLGTEDAIQMLVSSLNGTHRSVAGAVISRNPSKNWITRIQEWDYLFGISIVKRIQSMYSGALVCQGAFSAYEKSLLLEVGGWKNVVGEDIVLSWDILKAGYKTYHCTKAVALTDTPDNYKQFFHQRKRWSRGMIEAFRFNWRLLFKARLSTIFIWYNLFFPYIDFVFAFIFIPSVIGSLFFNYHLLASEKTLLIIPLSIALTTILYYVQKKTFREINMPMSKNLFGMIFYIICFQIIQTPATLSGYLSEMLKLKKNWGTKASKSIGIIIILLFSSSLVFSQDDKLEVGSSLINDTDKNLVSKTWAGYQRGTDSLSWGMEIGNVLISDKDNKNYLNYAGLNLSSKINKTFSVDLSSEQYLSEWKPFLYNGLIKIDPIEKIHMELLFSRGLIETQGALMERFSVYSNGLTADYEIIDKKLVLVGGYINQQFTDDNSRDVYIGKLAWVIKDWFVLSSTSKLMRAHNVSTYYFSPEIFDTHTLSVYKYMAIFKDNILLKTEFGGGLQQVNDYQKDFYYGKLLIKGNISKKVSLDLSALYSTAISEFGSYGLIFGHLKLYYSF